VLITIDAGVDDLCRVAFPPVPFREYLNFIEAAIARIFDPAPNAGGIDHPVSHHAAIPHQVDGRDEPVADMKAENSVSSPGNLLLELGGPPDVITIYGDTDAIAQRIA
jgi:hypothetical protein